tara:strand:- start:124 stop:726 length:603 start_codon:yes stop_codon:yes gene_type:complete
MARYRTNRILPVILTIVIIVIAIAGLVAFARILFFSDSSDTATQVDTSQQQLLDTSAGNAVSMTVRGAIVAQENFRSYQIVISPTERTIKTFSGYLGTVIEQQTLTNNVAAYDQFVHALDKANMVKGAPFTGEQNDVLGICATGKLYEFSTLKNGDTVEMLWTSTCSGSPGSLQANSTQLSKLFLAQIPDGSRMISGLSL